MAQDLQFTDVQVPCAWGLCQYDQDVWYDGLVQHPDCTYINDWSPVYHLKHRFLSIG